MTQSHSYVDTASTVVLLQHSTRTTVANVNLAHSREDPPEVVVKKNNDTSNVVWPGKVIANVMLFGNFHSLFKVWPPDVFNDPKLSSSRLVKGIDEHKASWIILGVVVLVLVAFDVCALQPLAAHLSGRAATSMKLGCKETFEGSTAGLQTPAAKPSTCFEEREGETGGSPEVAGPRGMGSTVGNVSVLAFWILMGVAFNIFVWARMGREAAAQWCTGYLLEWLLSLDNLFVFHLIFQTYATPRALLHKALFLGILGAVVFRMLFFVAMTYLLHLLIWVRFVFGVLLIYSGIQAARGDDDEGDVTNTLAVRFFKGCLGSRLSDTYDQQGQSLFIRGEDGRLKATLLVLVIACLEITDVLFAIDSVSAKVAQIPDYYIAYSSSVIAIFGLRSMFFIIQDIVDMFDMLKYGLCFILVFIGIELMISDWVRLPAHVVCVVIVSVFVIGIAGSLAQNCVRKTPQAA